MQKVLCQEGPDCRRAVSLSITATEARVAARFGALSFRSPAHLDLQAFSSERFFDDYDRAVSDNEFFGTHRGLPISIASLLLTSGSGKQRHVSFEGLLVEVTLPRGLQATTTVIASTGAFEQLRQWLKTSNSRASLIALYDHIAGVLMVADAVIDPDQAARSVAAVSTSRTSVEKPNICSQDRNTATGSITERRC